MYSLRIKTQITFIQIQVIPVSFLIGNIFSDTHTNPNDIDRS